MTPRAALAPALDERADRKPTSSTNDSKGSRSIHGQRPIGPDRRRSRRYPRQVRCIGAAIPVGLTLGGYDDDDADPTVIESDDDELDLLLFGR